MTLAERTEFSSRLYESFPENIQEYLQSNCLTPQNFQAGELSEAPYKEFEKHRDALLKLTGDNPLRREVLDYLITIFP